MRLSKIRHCQRTDIFILDVDKSLFKRLDKNCHIEIFPILFYYVFRCSYSVVKFSPFLYYGMHVNHSTIFC
jgi:hypothetical protein